MAPESSESGEGTDQVDVLDTILEEVRRIREEQKRQGDEIEKMKDRLGVVGLNIDVVRATQQSHGRELATLKVQCGKRFETCSDAMRRLREQCAGDE